MILKNRKYLFLLVILLLVFGCGSKKSSEKTSKRNNAVKAKSYDEIPEIDFSNKDIDTATLQNIIIGKMENPELSKSYRNLDISYRLTFFPDSFHNDYEGTFLDNQNNFIIPNEEKINTFSKEIEGIGYEELIVKMNKVKEWQKKEVKYKNEELDKAAEKFLSSLKEKIRNIEEIKQYYKNGKYKEDNFEKGKNLSEQYLSNRKKVEGSFKKFSNQRNIVKYITMKNTIGVLKDIEGKEVESDIIKLKLLFEMLNEKLFGTKLYLDTSKPFIIEEKDEVQYVNELKSIQKTIKNLLSDMKKTDVSKLEKENINSENYKKSVKEIEKISRETGKIIDNIEKRKNENLNEMISDYSKEINSVLEKLNSNLAN